MYDVEFKRKQAQILIGQMLAQLQSIDDQLENGVAPVSTMKHFKNQVKQLEIDCREFKRAQKRGQP